jgi:hypothetical protein
MKWNRKVILFKPEATYGVDSVPVAATNGLLVRNVSFRALNLAYERRTTVKGFYTNEGEIATGKWSEISFEIEMQGAGGAADAIPAWGPVLRCSSHAQTVNAGVSVQYDPISTAEEAASIYFQMDGRQHKMLGCRGSRFGMSVRAGAIPAFQLTFLGLHVQPTDTALTPATLTGFKKPLAANNANTTPFTLDAFAGKFREFSLDSGLQTVYRNLVGNESIQVTNRMPTGRIVLESELVATKDWWTIIKNETNCVLTFTHGTAVGSKVKIDAPAAQVTQPEENEEQNVAMLAAFLNVSASGGDEYRITSL